MIREIDIDRAYAYCKGGLTSAQRQNVEKRVEEDENFATLVRDIQELFKSTDEAKVDAIVQSWKLTRVNVPQDKLKQPEKIIFNKKPEEAESELARLLVELDKKKRLQKMYMLLALIFIVLILIFLGLRYLA